MTRDPSIVRSMEVSELQGAAASVESEGLPVVILYPPGRARPASHRSARGALLGTSYHGCLRGSGSSWGHDRDEGVLVASCLVAGKCLAPRRVSPRALGPQREPRSEVYTAQCAGIVCVGCKLCRALSTRGAKRGGERGKEGKRERGERTPRLLGVFVERVGLMPNRIAERILG